MSAFVTTWRGGIEDAQREFMAAHRAGQPDEAQAHRARLRDLLEVADRTGVSARAWVDPLVLVILGDE